MSLADSHACYSGETTVGLLVTMVVTDGVSSIVPTAGLRTVQVYARDDERFVHFWATVYKTVRPTLSDRRPVLPVCLSVTLVYYGQTV